MGHYNGEDDASRCGRKGPDTPAALAKVLAELFKGEEEEFIRIKRRDGFSMYNPPSWVSSNPAAPLILLPESILMNIILLICNRRGERPPGAIQLRPTAIGSQPGPLSRI